MFDLYSSLCKYAEPSYAKRTITMLKKDNCDTTSIEGLIDYMNDLWYGRAWWVNHGNSVVFHYTIRQDGTNNAYISYRMYKLIDKVIGENRIFDAKIS